MSEPKPTYTVVKRKSKAIKRPVKSAKIGAEFHALLTAMNNESDQTMQGINEMAIRIVAEMYYPHLIPVLTGGGIDETKRPKPFDNKKGETNEHY